MEEERAMNIKDRLQTLKEQSQKRVAQKPSVPKPTTDPGIGKSWKWNLTKMVWEARPQNEPTEFQAVESGKVTEQWSHYSSKDDSLFVAAQWDLKDENNQNWDANLMGKEILAHVTKKYKKEAKIIDLDWESGFALVQIENAQKKQASVEVYAELKDETTVCPMDETKIEVHACRGTLSNESCPFYMKADQKEFCSFKKFGAVQEKTSLDQFIEKNKQREASLRVASAVLNALSVPKFDRKASFTVPKEEGYKPVTRLARVVKGSNQGLVEKKNKDGSFQIKWDNGKEGAYWAHELNVIG
jgi:hypothetical protein